MARILVIDDDREILSILQDLLEEAGHEVLVAEDGGRGLALQREHPADLLITDIFMPHKDGFQTITELRVEFPGVKVIAMSGGSDLQADFLRVAEKLGAVVTVAKPFDCDSLVATVSDLVGR